jgi:hypothetical protein
LPEPNSNRDAGKSDANGYSYGYYHTTFNGYTDGNGNSDDASRIAYAYSNRDGDKHSACSANAKAAAYAVSTALIG